MQYSHLQTCKIKSAVLTLSKAKCLSHLCKMHNFGTQREDTHNCMKTWILLLKWEAYYILQLQWCCKGPREEKGNTCHPKISHPCELLNHQKLHNLCWDWLYMCAEFLVDSFFFAYSWYPCLLLSIMFLHLQCNLYDFLLSTKICFLMIKVLCPCDHTSRLTSLA